jgi:uncharacterized protein (TIGR02145 family)
MKQSEHNIEQQRKKAMQKNKRFFDAIYILIMLLVPGLLSSQVVVGSGTADGSSLLEVKSNTGGVLLPRMTSAERDAIASPATGLLVFNLTTICLESNMGTPSSPDWTPVTCRTGAITGINCAGATVIGTLAIGQAATNVIATVPYTGGNSGVYSGQAVTSTGVTGLTATLPAGHFADGSGSVSFIITGTPSAVGTANFALNIGGQSCTLSASVSYSCKAKTDATTFSNFLCYNLGAANTNADPFTPSWEINGGYWQWGRLAQAAAGPTGPNAGDANGGAISGWSTTVAPNGSWADGSKTSNDPCPAGYRVPTRAQWEGVIANNIATNVGTSWTVSPANYSTGKKFGNELMLPAAGYRRASDGLLSDRGGYVSYWSSTELGTQSWNMWFQNNYVDMDTDLRSYGMVVRCIEE